VASDLDKYPEPKPGLVFRYDYLRPREFADGIEHGKVRPACILDDRFHETCVVELMI